MKYKQIKIESSQEELEKDLKEYYGPSLVNFAYVIADVLAEETIFTKKVYGRKISDIKKEREDLISIKEELLKSLKSYTAKYFHPDLFKTQKKTSFKIQNEFYINEFRLKPFFNWIDECIKKLEKMMNIFEQKPDSGFIPWPDFKPDKRPFSYANQIAFLWSSALYDKNGIHWANICNLISWFLECLEDTSYKEKLYFGRKDEISGYPRVVKNQYQKIKKSYSFFMLLASCLIYFPFKKEKPLYPKATGIYKLGEGYQVISVKFYKRKIKTIFDEDGKLKTRETLLEKDKYHSIIRVYDQDEEDSEGDKLLLEVD